VIAVLCGGFGAARFLPGLRQVAADLCCVVNTGDDLDYLGLHVAPDVDSVLFNVNREGTTWFIPITDIGWLYFSVMLNLFDAWHLYFTDDQTGEPAGVGEWVGEGKLEFPITIGQIEQFIFQVETYPPGSIVQNMRLAAEAMGLGNWIFCGFFDDILMGAFPDLARGSSFAPSR
jgi:hypothetical protein